MSGFPSFKSIDDLNADTAKTSDLHIRHFNIERSIDLNTDFTGILLVEARPKKPEAGDAQRCRLAVLPECFSLR